MAKLSLGGFGLQAGKLRFSFRFGLSSSWAGVGLGFGFEFRFGFRLSVFGLLTWFMLVYKVSTVRIRMLVCVFSCLCVCVSE